jgi:two-component system, chemotaxis family, chemotaxis protein CheY
VLNDNATVGEMIFGRMREYGSTTALIPVARSRTVKSAFSRGGVMAQKKVLLVEDDLEIRDILQDLLEAEGYDVIPASHGKQALEFLAAAPLEDLPSLVVLDMMMPLVDGSQVLASMKSDPKLSPIPVVVLSAVARERPAGAAAFLRKPIPLQKFFDTVRNFVEAGLPRLAPLS